MANIINVQPEQHREFESSFIAQKFTMFFLYIDNTSITISISAQFVTVSFTSLQPMFGTAFQKCSMSNIGS